MEAEYRRAMRLAELAWVKALLKDIYSGKLDWNPQIIIAALAAAGSERS